MIIDVVPGRLPDYFQCGPLRLMSRKLKELLEAECRPGVVEFIPVDVFRDETRRVYRFGHVLDVVDCLDLEKSRYSTADGIVDAIDATKKELKARKDTAREARKSLEKELKDAHGKKRETWPREAEDRLAAAEEKEAIAGADFEYLKVEAKALKDSVKDIEEEFRNGLVKEGVVGAELGCFSSAADAAMRTVGRLIEDNRAALSAK